MESQKPVSDWEPKQSFLEVVTASGFDVNMVLMEFRLIHSESGTLSDQWDTLFARFFQRYKRNSQPEERIPLNWLPSGIALEQFILRGVDVNSDRFRAAVLKFRMYNSDINSVSVNWDALFLNNYTGFIDD